MTTEWTFAFGVFTGIVLRCHPKADSFESGEMKQTDETSASIFSHQEIRFGVLGGSGFTILGLSGNFSSFDAIHLKKSVGFIAAWLQ